MVTVTDFSVCDDQSLVSFHVTENGRCGIVSLYDNNNNGIELLNKFFDVYRKNLDDKDTLAVCQEIVDSMNVSLADRPKIEETSDVLQYIYQLSLASDGDCYFILDEEENSYIYDKFGLSQEDLEDQVMSEVEKYNLGNAITYGDSDNCESMVVYPILRDAFSEADVSVIVNSKSGKKRNNKERTDMGR